jgi:alanine racemase
VIVYDSILKKIEQSGSYSCLLISQGMIRHNYDIVQKQTKGACGAVVKSNAYGLGMEHVSKNLYEHGCVNFFVMFLDEGTRLRQTLGPQPNIFILAGAIKGTEKECIKHQLTPVLSTKRQFLNWDQYHPYAIFVDTGMRRTGLSYQDFEDIFPFIKKDPLLLLSHFACADEPCNPFNEEQYQKFMTFKKKLPHVKASLCNSSGVFLDSKYHFDIVRPGMALYGLNPTPYQDNPFKFPVSFWTKIIQIQHVSKGESIGYGRFFFTQKDSKIATVCCGYSDGVPWLLCKSSYPQYVKFLNYDVPIVGRISMDLITLDISDVPDSLLEENAWVQILGEFNADNWRKGCSSIQYETLTRLGQRMCRIYTS